MNTITAIKQQVVTLYPFTFSTSDMPTITHIHEKIATYSDDVAIRIENMKGSQLFTDDEIQEVANFAKSHIVKSANAAINYIREYHRANYHF